VSRQPRQLTKPSKLVTLTLSQMELDALDKALDSDGDFSLPASLQGKLQDARDGASVAAKAVRVVASLVESEPDFAKRILECRSAETLASCLEAWADLEGACG
jgi:hypothetical protein